jgi:hypothetical protein
MNRQCCRLFLGFIPGLPGVPAGTISHRPRALRANTHRSCRPLGNGTTSPSAALIITSAIAIGSKLRLESTSATPWRCSSLIISSITLIRRAFFALSSVMVPSAPRFHQLTHVHILPAGSHRAAGLGRRLQTPRYTTPIQTRHGDFVPTLPPKRGRFPLKSLHDAGHRGVIGGHLDPIRRRRGRDASILAPSSIACRRHRAELPGRTSGCAIRRNR